LGGKTIDELLSEHNDIAAVRNNGGGWWNHCQFWEAMSADGGGTPSGDLAAAIETTFGSFDEFKSIFHKAAMTRFGSGWAWLGVKDGGLCVCSSPNQDNPLMDGSCNPILGLDVWEHAYYKKYGPGRATYIDAWWDVVDWVEVSRRYSNCQ
jgi:Fe-Mn family superoxide dismutase